MNRFSHSPELSFSWPARDETQWRNNNIDDLLEWPDSLTSPHSLVSLTEKEHCGMRKSADSAPPLSTLCLIPTRAADIIDPEKSEDGKKKKKRKDRVFPPLDLPSSFPSSAMFPSLALSLVSQSTDREQGEMWETDHWEPSLMDFVSGSCLVYRQCKNRESLPKRERRTIHRLPTFLRDFLLASFLLSFLTFHLSKCLMWTHHSSSSFLLLSFWCLSLVSVHPTALSRPITNLFFENTLFPSSPLRPFPLW